MVFRGRNISPPGIFGGRFHTGKIYGLLIYDPSRNGNTTVKTKDGIRSGLKFHKIGAGISWGCPEASPAMCKKFEKYVKKLSLLYISSGGSGKIIIRINKR